MSARRSSDSPLAARRRQSRRRAFVGLGIFILILAGIAVWSLHRPSVRIKEVSVYGADESYAAYAHEAMRGSYLGLIPRDSAFFVPAGAIRTRILAEHPEIAAVSLFTNGVATLSIKVVERAPVARWCGSTGSPQAASTTERCYVFDAGGFIFAAADAASSTPINSFAVYAPLVGDREEPLRATIASAALLPKTFDFARQLSTLGSPVTSITLHDGEVDTRLASGTRVTYVVGQEQNAYAALFAARNNLDLTSGMLDYVDLRFGGKVYTKNK